MVEKNMVTLTERTIMKSRSGVYSDTAENRRKHRVGQKYGAEKQPEDGEKTEKKETDPAKELEAVNKVIAAINEGKLNLPAAEVMKLSEKKQKLEAAKKQAEKINAGVKANEEKKGASDEPEILQWGGKKDPDFRKGTKEQFQNLYKKIGGKTVDLGYYGKGKVVGMQVRDDGFTQAIVQTSKGSLLEASYSEVLEDKVEDMFGGGSLKRGLVIDPKALSSEKEKKTEEKKEVAPKEKGKDELSSAREELERHKEKKDSWIAKYGKNSYETRLEQIKDNVERLKNKTRSEKEKKSDEKNSKKAAEMKEKVKQEKKESLKNSEENVLGDGSKEKELSLKNEDGDSMFIRVYKDGAVRVEDVNLRKDFKNTEEAWNWLKKEGYTNSETGGKETSEETEVYTRIKFDDVPNSGKINLKKYLSEKVRKGVDEKWSNIKNIPTENLKKMEKGLVNDLNKNFEAIKKSQRAELLYSIMKVKGELESRVKETSKEGNKGSEKLSDLQSKVPGYMNMPEYKKYISAKSEVDNFGKVPSGGDKRQRYDELNEQLVEATKKYKEALKKKLTT